MNFFKINIYKNHQAFTLIELLVSISIFLIITGMVLTNFRVGQYRDELNGGAEALVTATREMQTATTSGRVVDCDGEPSTDPTTEDGWGVNISDSLVVTRYADCDGDFKFSVADIKVLADNNISSNVGLTTVTPISVNFPIDILFSSTSETVKINGGLAITEDLVITLDHAKTSNTVIFVISPVSGRIYYEKN